MFLKLAWRNVWRSRRRTLVTVGAMTLALTILILYTSLVDGMLRDLERNILELELGDLQIHALGFLDKPSIYETIEEHDKLIVQLEARGFRASPRLLGGALVAAGDASAGASLRGVDVDRDRRVSRIGEHLMEGAWLDPSDPSGLVLGRRLAHTLNAQVGDELVVLSQAVDGSIANDLFFVRGILQAVSDGTDRTGIFMTEAAFRSFFGLAGGAHEIILRRPEGVELEDAARQARSFAPGNDVKTWRDLAPTLASILDSTRGLILAIFFIVYVVIAILILNAMLMAVFERIRELGMLKALGIGPEGVLGLVFTEAGIQTALALLIGGLLSLPGLWYLTRFGIDVGRLGGMPMMGIAINPIWRAVVTPYSFFGPAGMLMGMVLLAIMYPASKAAHIHPVEAMRHP